VSVSVSLVDCISIRAINDKCINFVPKSDVTDVYTCHLISSVIFAA